MTGSRPLLLVLAVAAILLGFAVVGEGYPRSFYADERVNVQRALYFGAVGSANPGYFNKPALTYYVNFAAYGAVYAVGRVAGTFSGPESFGVWTVDNEGTLLLVGRIMTALSGLFLVWATWRLARRFGGTTTAVTASLFVAGAPAFLASSSVIKEDALSAAFATLSLVFMVDGARSRRFRDAAAAGLAAGLSMACKYYAVALFVPAVVLYARIKGERGGDVATRPRAAGVLFGVGAFAFFAGFFIGSPYNFLDPSFARDHVFPALRSIVKLVGLDGWLGLKSMLLQQDPTLFVDPEKETIFDLLGHAVGVLASAECLGIGVCVAAVVGLLSAMKRGEHALAALGVATLGMLVVLTAANRQHASPRHLLVLVPCVAVLAGRLLETLGSAAFGTHRGGVRSFATAFAALALVCVPSPGGIPAASSIRILGDGIAPDPRLAALRWLEREVKRGATVINYNEGIPLPFSVERCEWALASIPRLERLNPATHQRGYARLWDVRLNAARSRTAVDFDTILFEAPWQGVDESQIERSRSGYNPLWMERFPRQPSELPPVRRLTDVPAAERAVSGVESESRWPAARWIGRGGPPEYLVALEVGFRNFDQIARRIAYPSFAAFFDDLHAHYDAYEWRDPMNRKERTTRVYDLRTRVEGRAPVVRAMPLDG